MNNVISWLQTEHDQIMNCEKEAIDMMQKGDISGYRDKMREKAQLLAGLARKAAPEIAALPPRLASLVHQTLENYSVNASTALHLDSVFYMSALLYKDDHGKDEPDNFQQFINTLTKELNV